MKATGIVRQVDELGRIVLPVELRRTMNINIKDGLEIHIEGELIVLKKYEPKCVLCGDGKALNKFGEKLICRECIEDIKK